MTMSSDRRVLETERWKALRGLERWLETPMLALAFVWLGLLIVELIWGLGPVLEGLGTLIWIVFILDTAVRLALAPHKTVYFKKNWLTVIALALPALRVLRAARFLRVLRMARAARGLRLVRVVSSLNRGMRALGASMRRRGFAYVATLTLLVTLTGAAGMYVFERDVTTGTEPVLAGSGRAGEKGTEPVLKRSAG
jgi:voltage-gated potassium channel